LARFSAPGVSVSVSRSGPWLKRFAQANRRGKLLDLLLRFRTNFLLGRMLVVRLGVQSASIMIILLSAQGFLSVVRDSREEQGL